MAISRPITYCSRIDLMINHDRCVEELLNYIEVKILPYKTYNMFLYYRDGVFPDNGVMKELRIKFLDEMIEYWKDK